jgi:DNA topoisomerase-1
MQDVWDRIGGTALPRGLSAAERRLLAFLRKPRRRTAKPGKPAQARAAA